MPTISLLLSDSITSCCSCVVINYGKVHYEGFLQDDMSMFDSSRKRNQPLQLTLGDGFVMEGWEVALGHMQVGQLAEVTIPHLFAYGEQGYPPKIPPRSTLLFRMQIVRITPKPTKRFPWFFF